MKWAVHIISCFPRTGPVGIKPKRTDIGACTVQFMRPHVDEPSPSYSCVCSLVTITLEVVICNRVCLRLSVVIQGRGASAMTL